MIGHLPVGRRGALLELEDEDPEPAAAAGAVRDLAERLGIALTEVVPGARTLLVLAAERSGLQRLLGALDELPVLEDPVDAPEVVELRVRYDGPDLGVVAAAAACSEEEVVRRHAAATYRAAFTGFAPGFAYLTGLDPRLRLPRRDAPRPVVPAGSLAIADIYTAVYPRRSPGGWHLLGTVDTPVFDIHREPAARMGPGQIVRFVEATHA